MKKTGKARYLPKEAGLGSRVRILSKEERHEFPPEAFLPQNIKVRVTIYLDSDIVEFFKELSEKGARYQTRINAALRKAMEESRTTTPEDLAANLQKARHLINEALRKIS